MLDGVTDQRVGIVVHPEEKVGRILHPVLDDHLEVHDVLIPGENLNFLRGMEPQAVLRRGHADALAADLRDIHLVCLFDRPREAIVQALPHAGPNDPPETTNHRLLARVHNVDTGKEVQPR